TRMWVPAALLNETAYQKTLSNTFAAGEGGAAQLLTPFFGGAGSDVGGIVSAGFSPGANPGLAVPNRIFARHGAACLSGSNGAPPTSSQKITKSDREHFLRSTKMIPTDGVVKATAAQITASAKTDTDKARAIYEWIVDNTFRNPKTRGCGTGDIRYML